MFFKLLARIAALFVVVGFFGGCRLGVGVGLPPVFNGLGVSNLASVLIGSVSNEKLFPVQSLSYEGAGRTRLNILAAGLDNSGELKPALLFFHGGYWANGNAAEYERAIRQAAESGYAAFSVEYHLSGDPGGRWPAQLADARCAVRWVRSNAGLLGVDVRRIGVAGFSSGGHLALMLALAGEAYPNISDCKESGESASVAAVVAVSPPFDVCEFYLSGLKGGGEKSLAATSVENLLGLSGRDAVLAQCEGVSPLNYLDAGDHVPLLTLRGSLDGVVQGGQVARLRNGLVASPERWQHVEFWLGTHIWFGPYAKAASEARLSFFDYHLRSLGSKPERCNLYPFCLLKI